jgi:outer membrane protein assembly factor BamB
VIAIDPATGDRKWTFRMYDLTDSGILTTASDLLFTGGRDGYFQALDARTGELLWKSSFGSVQMLSGPITYEVEGRQYVATIGGNVLAAYALRDEDTRRR